MAGRWSAALRSGVEMALLTLLALVAVSGVALAFNYSPSVTHAWSSIAFLERAVPMGRFVRALHHDATHLLVGLGLVYLGALALAGFARRETKAWLGRVALAALVIGAAHLGLLLPADGRAVAATHELLSIAASVPFVGSGIAAFLRGGPAYGHLTLVHLNALHTIVIPVLGVGVVAWLRRATFAVGRPLLQGEGRGIAGGSPLPQVEGHRIEGHRIDGHGIAAPWLGLIALGTVVVTGVVAHLHAAPLWAPGDPTVAFPARPEWFLLPIFQLRRHLGTAEALATVGIPTLLLLGAVALTRAPAAFARGFVVLVALGFAGTFAWAERQDMRDPKLARMRADARREASDAVRLAALGISEGGPLTWDRNDPVVWGRHLFAQNCAVCHHDAEESPYQGDLVLQGYGSRAWLDALLGHLRSPYFFGNGKIDGMDDVPQGPHRAALVEFLISQSRPSEVDPALAKQGRGDFTDDGCESCHSLDGKGGDGAPDLLGYGGDAWLEAFIRDPGHARFYADQNVMRAFSRERLDDAELKAVVAYVRSRFTEPLNIPVTSPVQHGKVDAEDSPP